MIVMMMVMLVMWKSAVLVYVKNLCLVIDIILLLAARMRPVAMFAPCLSLAQS